LALNPYPKEAGIGCHLGGASIVIGFLPCQGQKSPTAVYTTTVYTVYDDEVVDDDGPMTAESRYEHRNDPEGFSKYQSTERVDKQDR
jgi:hypothetical protein